MKVSLSWLKTYVPVNLPVGDLADKLTMAGLEVGSVYDRYDYLKAVIVGCIREIAAHPAAAHLKCCRVDTGDGAVSVVCGAPNTAVGMLAPLALPGAVLPDGRIIRAGQIRGQASAGMLCSAAELALESDAAGLMALDDRLTVGEDLKSALQLNDPVLEIELTPNRPDCLSIIGIAREVRALQDCEMRLPDTRLHDENDRAAHLATVTLQAPDLCPRYAARLFEDIRVGPSPFWLQDRLLSVGQKPVNNIVDITNFVMLETGQPLHAFDFDRLAGQRIVVRKPGKTLTFTTLDGKERQLTADTLMICDRERAVAIAGVMGGQDSEIKSHTRRVLLESAYFDPASIRKTAKALGLSTEASHRFERGVDPLGVVDALNRAARLIVETDCGRLIEGLVDTHTALPAPRNIALAPERANRLLGTRLAPEEMTQLLESIGFKVTPRAPQTPEGGLNVQVPTFRVDVKRPEDIMEEIARRWGYDRIPTTFPKISTAAHRENRPLELRDRIRQMMTGFGFSEAVSYSFGATQHPDMLKLAPDDKRRRLLRILNPLTEDQAVMRTSLLPGLLEAVKRNAAWQIRDLKLFEIGHIFIAAAEKQQPEEIETLTALWTGAGETGLWRSGGRNCDFYDMKGVAEGLLGGLGMQGLRFTRLPAEQCDYLKPGYTAQIVVSTRRVGAVAQLAHDVLENFGVTQPVYIFELDLNQVLEHLPDVRQFKAIPKFPAIARDITLIISRRIEAMDIIDSVHGLSEPLVEKAYLFDVFEGRPIPEGQKSVSLRIVYRSGSGTLEDERVNRIHKDITDRLVQQFGASLPA